METRASSVKIPGKRKAKRREPLFPRRSSITGVVPEAENRSEVSRLRSREAVAVLASRRLLESQNGVRAVKALN